MNKFKYKNIVCVCGTLLDKKHGVSRNDNKYCNFSIEVLHERGKSRHSFTAFGAMCEEIDRAEAGDGWVQVSGRLTNRKNGVSGKWELQVWVDEVTALGGQGEPSGPTQNDSDDVPF